MKAARENAELDGLGIFALAPARGEERAQTIDDGTRTITFDPDRVYFFGHSQGGLTGPAYLAFEPALKGAVLSGTGGTFYLSLLDKKKPLDFNALITTLIRDKPVDEDNPTIHLAQMAVERNDPVNYAPFMVRDPQLAPDGMTRLTPRNIFHTEGFTDNYTPNRVIEAFARLKKRGFEPLKLLIIGDEISKYPALSAELLRRGYSDDDIRKIIGQNVLRVWLDSFLGSATTYVVAGVTSCCSWLSCRNSASQPECVARATPVGVGEIGTESETRKKVNHKREVQNGKYRCKATANEHKIRICT